MAVVVTQSGSQTCTVTTEHTVTTTVNTAGTYVFKVDLNASVNGDAFEVRVKCKARAADTARVIYFETFANVQDDPIKIGAPCAIAVNEALDCSIKQTTGTSRAVPWNLLQIDS